MIRFVKARTSVLAILLAILSIGYTFAQSKVVVVPLGGDEIPSGAVIAFNSNTCPSGWVANSQPQGRVIVGLNPGGNVGVTQGGSLVDLGAPSHNHQWARFTGITKQWFSYNLSGSLVESFDWTNGMDTEGSGFYPFIVDESQGTNISYFTDNGKHTMPYVQYLYCEKT